MHLTNEIDEAVPGLGHTLLGPIDELELPYGARGAIAGIGYLRMKIFSMNCESPNPLLGTVFTAQTHLELTQLVLRHIVLGNGIHNVILIAHRAFMRPILEALLLQIAKKKKR